MKKFSTGLLYGMLSSFEAESNAFLKGLLFAESESWESCLFAIDCCELFNYLNCGISPANKAAPCISRCFCLLLQHTRWRVVLVNRDCNKIADSLAKKAVMEGLSYFSSDFIPEDLSV